MPEYSMIHVLGEIFTMQCNAKNINNILFYNTFMVSWRKLKKFNNLTQRHNRRRYDTQRYCFILIFTLLPNFNQFFCNCDCGITFTGRIVLSYVETRKKSCSIKKKKKCWKSPKSAWKNSGDFLSMSGVITSDNCIM